MSNVAVKISADTGQLRAQLVLASAEVKAFRAETTKLAADARAASGDMKAELLGALEKASGGLLAAEKSSASLRKELKELSNAGEGLGHGGIATATREFRALFDELSSGRTRQTPGTLAILATNVFGLQGAALAGAGGVLALAAALGEAAIQGERTAEAIGNVEAALAATGQGDFTDNGIGKLIIQLRELPEISTKMAEEMLADMARVKDIGTANFEALGYAAAGFSRASGEDAPQALKTLMTALAGNGDELRKLDEQYNIFHEGQLQQIHDAQLAGENNKAYAIAIEGLLEKFGPLIDKGLTPTQVAANRLGLEWRGLMEDIAGTPGTATHATSALSLITDALTGATGALRGFLQTGLTGAVVGGVSALSPKPAPPTPTTAPAESDPLTQARAIAESNRQYAESARSLTDLTKRAAALSDALKNVPDSAKDLKTELTAELAEVQRRLETAQNRSNGGNQVAQWTEQLHQQLEATNTFGKAALAAELKFWTDKQALAQGDAATEREVAGEIFRIRSEMASQSEEAARRGAEEAKRARQQSLQDELRSLEETTDAAKQGSQERINDARQEADFAIAQWGQFSAEARSALKRVEAANAEFTAEQKRQLDDWFRDYSTGIQDQIREAQGNTAEQERLTAEWIKAGEALYGEDVAKYREALAEKEALSKEAARKEQEQNKEIATDLTQSLMSMLRGRQSFAQSVEQLGERLLSKELEQILEGVVSWVRGDTTKTASTAASGAAQVATKQATAAAGKAVDAEAGATSVLGDANKAAAGAFSAVAGIPYIGPVLAPIAAAAAFTGVMAYDIFSAEDGIDRVPYDGAPFLLHANETVLPAAYAGGLRDLLTSLPSVSDQVRAGMANYSSVNDNSRSVSVGDINQYVTNNHRPGETSSAFGDRHMRRSAGRMRAEIEKIVRR